MVFLQLPYFVKEVDECTNHFERIIYVLKHMEILQRMPFLAQDAVFKRLSEIAEVASMTKDERRQYDESLKHYRDTIAVMEGQYMEGKAEGKAEEKIANARSLKENGVPSEVIARSLGLAIDEIEQL